MFIIHYHWIIWPKLIEGTEIFAGGCIIFCSDKQEVHKLYKKVILVIGCKNIFIITIYNFKWIEKHDE